MASLLSYLWGDSGLSDEERARKVSELRGELGSEASCSTAVPARDSDLEAFLIARDYDVARAAVMWRASWEWRQSTFPIAKTEGIERILASKRYRDAGFNKESRPRRVLIFDALWGAFLEGEDEQELISAFLIWFEEQMSIIDAEHSASYSMIHLATGGPPPFFWCQRLAAILEANYPERLHKAVAFPVPWLLRRVVASMLWFLPQRTQDKWAFVSDLGSLAEACSLDTGAFPEDIQKTTLEDLAAKGLNLSSGFQWTRNAEGNDSTLRTAYVAAGGSEKVSVDIGSGVEWLEWSCGVDTGYDVGLHVAFQAEGQPTADAVVLREEGRFQDLQKGPRFTPTGSGQLLFHFENTYSWINGKNVYAEVVVHHRASD